VADADSERKSQREETIIIPKSRLWIEGLELPAYKRQKRKLKIGVAVLFLFTLLSVTLIIVVSPLSNALLLPFVIIWGVGIWLWTRPETKELAAWRKRRLAELEGQLIAPTPDSEKKSDDIPQS
jgi:hypothetical protein